MTVPPLRASALRWLCPPESLPFATTAEVDDLAEPLGQTRAMEALRFGLGLPGGGYNVFVLGPADRHLRDVVLDALRAHAATRPSASDWCYVHSFSDPRKPMAVALPAGKGRALRDEMSRLTDDLLAAIPAAFEADEYRARRQAIADATQAKHDDALAEIRSQAESRGATLVRTPGGVAFAPLRDGKVMSTSEFQALEDTERGRVQALLEELQKAMQDLVRQVPRWERVQRDQLRELDREITALAVDHLVDDLVQRWAEHEPVVAYLTAVRADVIDNAVQFLALASAEQGANTPGLSGDRREALSRYRVNVLVEREPDAGAPVVYEDQPSLVGLVGGVEHLSVFGALITDFTLIRAGALHRANGGYLVLDALRLLTSPFAWDALKRALFREETRIESAEGLLALAKTVSLEPEPMPLAVKVVLLGDRRLYTVLSSLDPEFTQLFKVAAEFDDEVDRTDEAVGRYAQLVATEARRNGLRPLTRDAVARVIEQGTRLTSDQRKLSASVSAVTDLLREADQHAAERSAAQVDAEDVASALTAREAREGRVRERVQEAILRDVMHIETTGARVGQVNGLAVLQVGALAFGKPSRITARVRVGSGEVVDIEREVDLGGPLHSKGVLILDGFLGARFGAELPLTLHASLVFEQSYGGIDGDSASLAEAVALLSALAEVPVRQGVAVTGSISQLGDVQPIGGVNEKIEGFFDVCAARGLTRDQGVAIPASNLDHLVLRPDVIAACGDERFHVWAVRDVDEALEVLTGVPAGKPGADGVSPEGSVNRLAADKLRRFAETARTFARRDGAP